MALSALMRVYPPMRLYGKDIQPYPSARRFLNDRSRYSAVLGSRDYGKTMTIALKAARWAVDAEDGTEIILVSRSQRQAAKLKDYIDMFLADYEKWKKDSATEVVLAHNKAHIYSLPNSPDTIRAYHGHVLIDEADMFKNIDEIVAAVFPMVLSGHNIVISGTPKRGKHGLLYDVFEGHRGELSHAGKWSCHRFHYSEAKHISQEALEFLRGFMTKNQWDQEMELKFIDDDLAYFPWHLLQRALTNDYMASDKDPAYPNMTRLRGNYAPSVRGFDPATETESAVIDTAMEKDGRMRVVADTIFFHAPYKEQLDWLRANMRGIECMEYDATGNKALSQQIQGDPVISQTSLKPIDLGPLNKAVILEHLRLAFENGLIMIPADCEELLDELNSVTREERAGMPAKYDGGGKHAQGRTHHYDRAIALALAYAAASGTSGGGYTPDAYIAGKVRDEYEKDTGRW